MGDFNQPQTQPVKPVPSKPVAINSEQLKILRNIETVFIETLSETFDINKNEISSHVKIDESSYTVDINYIKKSNNE